MGSLRRALNDGPTLAVLDSTVIVAVLLAGEFHHFGAAVLSNPLAVVDVLVSFLVGWGVAAALLGLYGSARLGGGRHSLRAVAVAALAAVNVGLIVRSLAFGDPPVSPFPAVITATLLVALCTVRFVVKRTAAPAGDPSVGSGEYQAQD